MSIALMKYLKHALPVPNPNITSSVPSWFISNVRIGESDVSFGKFRVHTSSTTKLLQGRILDCVVFVPVLFTIQVLNLSRGKGNIETRITTSTISPEKEKQMLIIIVILHSFYTKME